MPQQLKVPDLEARLDMLRATLQQRDGREEDDRADATVDDECAARSVELSIGATHYLMPRRAVVARVTSENSSAPTPDPAAARPFASARCLLNQPPRMASDGVKIRPTVPIRH